MLWMRVIEVKYGCEWEGWGTSIIPSPYGVCLWKTIRGVGLLCRVKFNKRLEMGHEGSFGKTSGVG